MNPCELVEKHLGTLKLLHIFKPWKINSLIATLVFAVQNNGFSPNLSLSLYKKTSILTFCLFLPKSYL